MIYTFYTKQSFFSDQKLCDQAEENEMNGEKVMGVSELTLALAPLWIWTFSVFWGCWQQVD